MVDENKYECDQESKKVDGGAHGAVAAVSGIGVAMGVTRLPLLTASQSNHSR